MCVTSPVLSWCVIWCFDETILLLLVSCGTFFGHQKLCPRALCFYHLKKISLYLNLPIMYIKKLSAVPLAGFFLFFFVCMWVIFKMENTKFVQIFCTVHIFQISGPSSNCLTDSYLIKIFIMCAGLRLVVLHFRIYSQILILLYVSMILLYMQKNHCNNSLVLTHSCALTALIHQKKLGCFW